MKRNPLPGICAVFLAFCLTSLPARAAEPWPDLPSSHWAYDTMSRAHELGIVTGMVDGTMQPEGVLSWGEYLAMLGRSLLADSVQYAAPLPDNAHWAYGYYMTGWMAGALQDYMPVSDTTLNVPISRQDAAVLAVRALEGEPCEAPIPAAADFFQLPAEYRPGVARAYALGLLSGYPDGTFGGSDALSRAQGVSILLRALDQSPAAGGLEPSVSPPLLPAMPGVEPEPDPALDESSGWGGWNDWDPWGFGFYDPGEEYDWDPLKWPGENVEKYLRLFGSEDKRRFASKEEAQASMVTVTVPVWRLNGGVKTPGTASFLIHKALADEILEIFTEIYNDPEQFPIQDVGGYSWRGDSATGEHNCGTAIDINSNENYQVQDGQAKAGSLWQPGVNPYSIPADGCVVRIFAEHGWSWGGDAWSMDTDPAVGYHDYMHFSYMGG